MLNSALVQNKVLKKTVRYYVELIERLEMSLIYACWKTDRSASIASRNSREADVLWAIVMVEASNANWPLWRALNLVPRDLHLAGKFNVGLSTARHICQQHHNVHIGSEAKRRIRETGERLGWEKPVVTELINVRSPHWCQFLLLLLLFQLVLSLLLPFFIIMLNSREEVAKSLNAFLSTSPVQTLWLFQVWHNS